MTRLAGYRGYAMHEIARLLAVDSQVPIGWNYQLSIDIESQGAEPTFTLTWDNGEPLIREYERINYKPDHLRVIKGGKTT